MLGFGELPRNKLKSYSLPCWHFWRIHSSPFSSCKCVQHGRSIFFLSCSSINCALPLASPFSKLFLKECELKVECTALPIGFHLLSRGGNKSIAQHQMLLSPVSAFHWATCSLERQLASWSSVNYLHLLQPLLFFHAVIKCFQHKRNTSGRVPVREEHPSGSSCPVPAQDTIWPLQSFNFKPCIFLSWITAEFCFWWVFLKRCTFPRYFQK